MSDLRGMNVPAETGTGGTPKLVGAIIVMLMLAAAGTYTYETGMWRLPSDQVVSNDRLPSPTPLDTVPEHSPPGPGR